VPIQTTPNFQPLSAQLSALADKVKAGLSGDSIVQELQQALRIIDGLSIHDNLTGALNRRGLIEKLSAEINRAKRTGHPFSFAIIAIDRYAVLAEQYGAAASNQILQNVTQAALGLFRSLDSFARIGDDQFAVILPTTWLDQSEKPFARLSNAISTINWNSTQPTLTVSFSTGITTNAPDDDAEKMLLRAADALAIARSKGPGASAQLEPILPAMDAG
jgi:diguanylate cyclase (GGDEF)-like protein